MTYFGGSCDLVGHVTSCLAGHVTGSTLAANEIGRACYVFPPFSVVQPPDMRGNFSRDFNDEYTCKYTNS